MNELRNRMLERLGVSAYASHDWQSIPLGYDGEGGVYCHACGCENRGDPKEFPELTYPFCNDMEDDELAVVIQSKNCG